MGRFQARLSEFGSVPKLKTPARGEEEKKQQKKAEEEQQEIEKEKETARSE